MATSQYDLRELVALHESVEIVYRLLEEAERATAAAKLLAKDVALGKVGAIDEIDELTRDEIAHLLAVLEHELGAVDLYEVWAARRAADQLASKLCSVEDFYVGFHPAAAPGARNA